jgi:peptide/nickel transport system ATP-binding protein
VNAPLFEARDVVKRFAFGRRSVFGAPRQQLLALAGVSFALERNAALGLVGESGSGKSTLGRIATGLLALDAGELRFDGAPLPPVGSSAWLPLRRRIQFVFQDPLAALDPAQRAGAAIAEVLAMHRLGKPRERRVRALQVLDVVGLGPEHAAALPHELSGGQRQRVALARALVLEPELLVLDEPTSALDVSVQAQVLNLLAELRERFGLTYLLIAHDLAVVRQMCERVAVLYLGRIVESGPAEEVLARPRHPYTQALAAAVPIPDPRVEAARGRTVLTGEPPSAAHPPSGCVFHPRCARRSEVADGRCEREAPRLESVALGAAAHASACHLADDEIRVHGRSLR